MAEQRHITDLGNRIVVQHNRGTGLDARRWAAMPSSMRPSQSIVCIQAVAQATTAEHSGPLRQPRATVPPLLEPSHPLALGRASRCPCRRGRHLGRPSPPSQASAGPSGRHPVWRHHPRQPPPTPTTHGGRRCSQTPTTTTTAVVPSGPVSLLLAAAVTVAAAAPAGAIPACTPADPFAGGCGPPRRPRARPAGRVCVPPHPPPPTPCCSPAAPQHRSGGVANRPGAPGQPAASAAACAPAQPARAAAAPHHG